MCKERIKNKELRKKLTSPEEAASLIKNGMTVFMSGYTNCGYPKAIAGELVKRKQKGEELSINLVTGSQIGPEAQEALGTAGILNRCGPLIESKALASLINKGKIHYVEQQMSKLPRMLADGSFGHIDVAVAEVSGITENGYLIPSTSIGMLPNFLLECNDIILEVNKNVPVEVENLHDIYLPQKPPMREPIPLVSAKQRIGSPYFFVPAEKIRYIIESDIPDFIKEPPHTTEITKSIVRNLFSFLFAESKRNWDGKLMPLQTGFGAIVQAVLDYLKDAPVHDLEFFCGGVTEGHIRLLEMGKVKAISTGSLQMTPYVSEFLRNNTERFKRQLIIRNTDITNCGEIIGRLGIVALNSGIEADIYGNINASHIAGNKVVNGLGGGANFAQNALLSIVMLPSITKEGGISSIVPMVPHCDIGEHDVDILITENGVADLRGKDDLERANTIIENCSSEIYRERLNQYLDKAINNVGGHHPLLLSEAFSWHQLMEKQKTMCI